MRKAICCVLMLALLLLSAAALAQTNALNDGADKSGVNFARIQQALADGANIVKEEAQVFWAEIEPEARVWRTKAGEALEAGGQVMKEVFDHARKQADAWWKKTPDKLQSVGDVIAESFAQTGRQIGDAWETAKPGLQEAGSQAGEAITSGLSKAWEGLSGLCQ